MAMGAPSHIVSAAIALAAVMAAVPVSASDDLPSGFVFLADVAPEIEQDLRYASNRNFTGRPVPGYAAGECVLTRRTALALAQVQKSLATAGYGLRVYDCYRPRRASAAFITWAERPERGEATRRYHPRVEKSELIGSGYISSASAHSSGTAVDLTLIRLAPAPASDPPAADSGCGAPPDGSVDMGTGFDCFDTRSHANAKGLPPAQREARQILRNAMRDNGFRDYTREWWHFSFGKELQRTLHDFVVPARSKTSATKAK